MKNLAGDRLTH